MKRIITVLMVAALLGLWPMMAWAGPFDVVKGWFSWGAVALILSGLIAMGGLVKYTSFGSRVLIALGSLFTTLGISLSDNRISGDELKAWVDDYRKLVEAVKAGWKS